MRKRRTRLSKQNAVGALVGLLLLPPCTPLYSSEPAPSAFGDCRFSPGLEDYPTDMKRKGQSGRMLVSVERNANGRLVNFTPIRVEVDPTAVRAARFMLAGISCPKTQAPKRLTVSIVYAMLSQPAPKAFPESDVKLVLTGSLQGR